MVPRKATLIPNPIGTAAGFLFRDQGKSFIVLPGVPYEMKEMIDRSVVPLLSGIGNESIIRHLTLRTTGITESALAEDLGDLEPILQGARLAFLPSPTGVRLRVTLHDTTPERADERMRGVEERLRTKVRKYIYGTGVEELEDVLGRLLGERGLTLAVAESCTGGLITDRLTNVAGSSAYVDRSVVAYSNRSKVELLGVPADLIAKHGAVSREVAEAMAVGIRTRSGTDIGLSTTGIAGPSGGSPEKPVGLVWIGYSDASGTLALRFVFGGGRKVVKERASQAALDLVRRRLVNTS